MRKLKIVIDTNLWISFIIKAKQAELTAFLLANSCRVYTCQELILELSNVLQRPKIKKYLSRPVQEYIDLHRKLTTEVRIKTVSNLSSDPKDNYLIDLTLTTRATYLVTGDKQLLGTKNISKFDIITYAELKAKFSSK